MIKNIDQITLMNIRLLWVIEAIICSAVFNCEAIHNDVVIWKEH